MTSTRHCVALTGAASAATHTHVGRRRTAEKGQVGAVTLADRGSDIMVFVWPSVPATVMNWSVDVATHVDAMWFFCRNCWCRRGIKRSGSRPIIGFFIHYNFVRPHMAIAGRTPAQAAGITIHGPDRWRTMIGSAAPAAGAAPWDILVGSSSGGCPCPGGTRRPVLCAAQGRG